MDFSVALDAIEPTGTNERERLFRALVLEAAPRARKRLNGPIDNQHGRTHEKPRPRGDRAGGASSGVGVPGARLGANPNTGFSEAK
jgi:hypothetical protein